jgi:hypothetical protein
MSLYMYGSTAFFPDPSPTDYLRWSEQGTHQLLVRYLVKYLETQT